MVLCVCVQCGCVYVYICMQLYAEARGQGLVPSTISLYFIVVVFVSVGVLPACMSVHHVLHAVATEARRGRQSPRMSHPVGGGFGAQIPRNSSYMAAHSLL